MTLLSEPKQSGIVSGTPFVSAVAALLVPLLQHWRTVVGVPLAAGVITALISTVVKPTYTATTTFTAEVGSGSALPADLADVAGRLGVATGRTGSSRPDFFAEVLTSDEITRAMLRTSFVDEAQSPPVKRELVDILNIRSQTPKEREAKGVRKIRHLTHASFSTRTDIVTLNVTAHNAQLAADMANRMVQLLDSFNIVRRQYQSRELRRFAGERLREAQQELKVAEDSSLRFLQVNRRISDSPVLTFQAKRLEREVELRQGIVVTLAREYEQARIAEHRDVPLLSIIDPARAPYRKSAPRRLLNTLMAMFVAVVIVVIAIYLRAMWTKGALEERSSRDDLVRAWEAFRAELRNPLRHERPSRP